MAISRILWLHSSKNNANCLSKGANHMISLSSIVRFHRREAGLSQVGLADMAGVSRKVIQEIESGRDGVTWRNVLAVLKTLNIALKPEGPLVARWREKERSEATPVHKE